MTYEFCEKLKDLGFSQNGGGKYWEPTHYGASGTYVEKLQTKWCVYIPTLSELIEACGPKFKLLIKAPKNWEAHGFSSKNFGLPILIAEGKTPEEAVAKLWLELNKKND